MFLDVQQVIPDRRDLQDHWEAQVSAQRAIHCLEKVRSKQEKVDSYVTEVRRKLFHNQSMNS